MTMAASSSSSATIAPWLAFGACAYMAFQYVALLYAPSVLLRLPPPSSDRQHLLRRFACATIATLSSLALSFRLIPNAGLTACLDSVGFRAHHWWQAIVLPLLLISLLYLGPLIAAALDHFDEFCEGCWINESSNCRECFQHAAGVIFQSAKSLTLNIQAWKNLIVAPLTEEVVFRGCMLSLLVCAGLRFITMIFLCPLFFGLAHANHFWELVYLRNCTKKRAFAIVGLQLGYTTVFGWYASFLFLRTGNLLAPVVTHIFCNIMGFPDFNGVLKRRGLLVIYVRAVCSLVCDWLL